MNEKYFIKLKPENESEKSFIVKEGAKQVYEDFAKGEPIFVGLDNYYPAFQKYVEKNLGKSFMLEVKQKQFALYKKKLDDYPNTSNFNRSDVAMLIDTCLTNTNTSLKRMCYSATVEHIFNECKENGNNIEAYII